MAGQEGFEPPTRGFGDRCSSQLELLAFMQIISLTRKFKITNVPVALLGFLVSGVFSAKFAKSVSL